MYVNYFLLYRIFIFLCMLLFYYVVYLLMFYFFYRELMLWYIYNNCRKVVNVKIKYINWFRIKKKYKMVWSENKYI